jgi:serine/threonine-protein kinase
MRTQSSQWLPEVAIVLAALTLSGAAVAQPNKDAVAIADALFEEALALMEEGKHSEACPKLQESQRLDPGLETLFKLSECYEHTGRTATAWSGYRDVAATADAAGESARAQVARDRAAALKPKLSRLRIAVSTEAAVPGLRVHRNGVMVGALLWGTDVPVDPGKYVVSASAPLREPWSTTVTVSNPGEVVMVRVPVLQDVADMRQPTRAPEPAAKAIPADEPPRRSLVPLSVGVGAAVVGIGLGVGFTVSANWKASNAEEMKAALVAKGADSYFCGASGASHPGCADLKATVDAKDTMSNVALWSFVAAGTAGAGAISYLLWPQQTSAAVSKPAVSVAVGPSSGGVFMTGAF